MKSLPTFILSALILTIIGCSSNGSSEKEKVKPTTSSESLSSGEDISEELVDEYPDEKSEETSVEEDNSYVKVFHEVIPQHDFTSVISGDTVYFRILEDGQSVSLVFWGRNNFDNHVVEVPSSVSHQGKEYPVIEIGDEAMGVELYGAGEWERVWAGDDNKVERIIIPSSVRKIGDWALTGRFRSSSKYRVELPNSIEYIGDGALNCRTFCDKNHAIILPESLRKVGFLQDAEDLEEEAGAEKFTKLYIPEHLQSIDGLEGYFRGQPLYEKVEVHPDNKYFKEINGTLYSYNLDSIYWATLTENLYIPANLKVDMGSIAFIEDGWYPHIQMPQFKTIVVEEGNPFCVVVDNILYDKKNKCLIMPAGDPEGTVHVPSWCNSVRIVDSFDYALPSKYIFSNSASQKSVDSFIEDITECASRPLTFVYKGKTWTSDSED